MGSRVEGKVAIVTGGASGIGQSCAELLAAEGASVVITDLQEELGEQVAEGIRARGRKAIFRRQDVTVEDEWVTIVATAKQEFGGLNVLVNNAGVGMPKPLVETSLEQWRLQMSVNLDAPFLAMKHAAGLMKQSGGGSIVNISSEAGINPWYNMSAYSASKAGVRLLSKVAALEFSREGDPIRVNSVHPGAVESGAWTAFNNKETGVNERLLEHARNTIPLGFYGLPEDIAQAVLYLASDESRFVTGTELVVDGGTSAAPPNKPA